MFCLLIKSHKNFNRLTAKTIPTLIQEHKIEYYILMASIVFAHTVLMFIVHISPTCTYLLPTIIPIEIVVNLSNTINLYL